MFILVSPLADVRNYFCKKANIRTPSLKIVFVCFWNFQKTFNRLRNFAVGIWRHAYAHGISSDWKYHVAFHDRHTRILWNTGRRCFFMIRCLILLSTQQLTKLRIFIKRHSARDIFYTKMKLCMARGRWHSMVRDRWRSI